MPGARAAGHIGEGLPARRSSHFGTADQHERFLPGIVRATELWCQGYSEPNAGSDLANVQTRAELDGDEWVINGQKVWTSLAHWADWASCCAAPTGRRPHKGLSYLLVPMDQTGHRDPPDPPDHRHRRVQRGVLRRRPHGGRQLGRRARRRLEGRDGTLAFERGALDPGPAARVRARAARDRRAAHANGQSTDPVCVSGWRSRGSACASCADTLRVLVGDSAELSPRGDDQQAVLGDLAPRARRAGHGRARSRRR